MLRIDQHLRRRLRLALVSVVVLSVQSFNLAHLIVAPHGVCAEHGEAIELTRAQALSPVSTDALEAAAASLFAGAADVVEHTHCDIAIQDRESRVSTKPIAVLVIPVTRSAPDSFFDIGIDASSQKTYRIAPKASPPSLAS